MKQREGVCSPVEVQHVLVVVVTSIIATGKL